MVTDKSVFVPDQAHHKNIEGRQHNESETVGVGKAVELVDDETAEDDKRDGIGPELVAKQTDDKGHFDDAVAEEIEGIEMLGSDGIILKKPKTCVATKSSGSSINSSWVSVLTSLGMALVLTKANTRPPMHSIKA
jgi:hypothetical protein